MRTVGHRLPKGPAAHWWVLQSSPCHMRDWCCENCQQTAHVTRTFETLCTHTIPHHFIYNLLSSKWNFVWGAKYQAAFELLKHKLTTRPVLALPAFEWLFDPTYNAPIIAVGDELSQGGRSVEFYSKNVTPAENHYHVKDRKLMAVYLACMKWRHYLQVIVGHV